MPPPVAANFWAGPASITHFPLFKLSGAVVEYLFYYAFSGTGRRRRGYLGNNARHRAKTRGADGFGLGRIGAHRARLSVHAHAGADCLGIPDRGGPGQQDRQNPESSQNSPFILPILMLLASPRGFEPLLPP